MRASHRLVNPLVVGLVVLGAVAAVATVWAVRRPAPLPALAVETLTVPTGVELPAQVSGGADGAAFTVRSPVEGRSNGENILTVALDGPPTPSQLGVFWARQGDGYPSLDDFTDTQRRHPENSLLVGEPVVEHSALGAAVRKDLRMGEDSTLTQWAVEHEGYLVLVEWLHHPDDERWRPTVEAMIGSWRWD